ncbi:TPA: type IVB secretion system protein IcmH/DotU, partial [Legionella pneumophila]|nr:type IVB secretion system protein IcmH/DotU [Legionella pneumophila]
NPLPKTIKKNYKATWITTIAAVGIVILAFVTSHVLLENKAKTVLFGHTQLAMLEN